jgi:hypothetical protein
MSPCRSETVPRTTPTRSIKTTGLHPRRSRPLNALSSTATPSPNASPRNQRGPSADSPKNSRRQAPPATTTTPILTRSSRTSRTCCGGSGVQVRAVPSPASSPRSRGARSWWSRSSRTKFDLDLLICMSICPALLHRSISPWCPIYPMSLGQWESSAVTTIIFTYVIRKTAVGALGRGERPD